MATFPHWQHFLTGNALPQRGDRNRSYGVNTGGLYDLYRRPKLVVDEVRALLTAKSESD